MFLACGYLAGTYSTTAERILVQIGLILALLAFLESYSRPTTQISERSHPTDLQNITKEIQSTAPVAVRFKTAQSLLLHHNKSRVLDPGLLPFMLIISRHMSMIEALKLASTIPTIHKKPIRGVIFGGTKLDVYAFPSTTKLEIVNPKPLRTQEKWLRPNTLKLWKK